MRFQTLQFLPEKEVSLSEMGRVVKPGGRIALSLWCNIEENPYFYVLVEAIARHISPETSAGLKAAFALSDANEIHRLLKGAGLGQTDMTVTQLDLPLPALAEFIPRHVSATPMAAGFSRAPTSVQQTVIQEVGRKLSRYATNGHTRIPFRSQMVMCRI